MPDDAEKSTDAADAARFRYLLEHCSYSCGMTQEQPAEHSLGFEWQQCTPAQRWWTLRDAIDRAMRLQAEADREPAHD